MCSPCGLAWGGLPLLPETPLFSPGSPMLLGRVVKICPGGTWGKLQPRWQKGPPKKDHVAGAASAGWFGGIPPSFPLLKQWQAPTVICPVQGWVPIQAVPVFS